MTVFEQREVEVSEDDLIMVFLLKRTYAAFSEVGKRKGKTAQEAISEALAKYLVEEQGKTP